MHTSIMKSGKPIILLLSTFCLIPILVIGADIYVDQNASGSNDGTTWGNGYTHLQDAFDQPPSSGDVIHVAQGTYYPDEESLGTEHTDDNRAETFQMISQVNMLGGYPTGGGSRNPSANPTILSGDLDQSATDPQNNDAYHVLMGANNATIDGFTITSGYANGPSVNDKNGGGIMNIGVSPTIQSCTITDNKAQNYGCGMQNQGSAADPTITNCTFSNNTSGSQGGGMNNYQGSPTVTRCTFSNNSCTNGAGMYNNTATSQPTVTNCVFSGNTASSNGGGMYNNNGVPTLRHCSFSNNTATGNGDGIYSNNGSTNATLTNCILWGSNDQIYDAGAAATTATYSDIQQAAGTFPGTGNMNTDPIYESPPGNLHLNDYSPCIGAGTDVGVSNDRDGSTRPQPALSNPDMGAYENSRAVSLPVELVMFSAIHESNKVILSWITESEVDNIGFILEKKVGGTEWIQIASYQTCDDLKGQGNTSAYTEYVFTDGDVEPGMTYSYRLSDVDTKGHISVDDVISITLDKLPELTELKPAFPNPFNPLTRITYTLVEDTDVTLTVVDIMGRTIQTIIEEQNQAAGSYSIHWNGKDENGAKAVSGTYLLVLHAGEVIKTQKVMLLR